VTARILPFPLVRRRDFGLRTATRIAEARSKIAERLLALARDIQVQAMQRRGIAPDLITREARAFENALRVEMGGLPMLEGDTA
jgi:hypothetical protein